MLSVIERDIEGYIHREKEIKKVRKSVNYSVTLRKIYRDRE